MTFTEREVKWLEQVVQESEAWARLRNPSPSEDNINSFKAGVRQGWRQAIVTLRAQGLLKEKK